MRARFPEGLATLPPAYFALVIATGLVTVAAHLEEWDRVAHALSLVNLAAFGVLWVLFLLRLAWFPHEVGADFGDFHRAPGFFNGLSPAACPRVAAVAAAGDLHRHRVGLHAVARHLPRRLEPVGHQRT